MYPWLVRNVFFRAHELVKRHPTYKILADMEAADRMPVGGLSRRRDEKLREFIAYCYVNVPFVTAKMQEAGLKPSDIRDPDGLALLPIMRKADIRKHRAELRSRLAGNLRAFTTGGSTGEPLVFDISKRRMASHVACRQRISRWWGVSVGEPELALWGSPIELTRQDRMRHARDILLATRLLSAFEMNEESMSRYLDILEKGSYKQLFGYPSAIYLLCLHTRKQGRDLRGLGIKVVFVTSEVLYPHQRELIAETLNAPVANGYGGRDSGFIAHECPQGGMHIMADASIVEIVDAQGRRLPPGEPGEIVATDLYSEEVPFLRYGTGDIGVLSNRRCACGREHPLLERIDGRSNDSVIAPDGRIMNALALVYPLREIDGIEEFRICQKRVGCLHVQMVTSESFPRDGEERIRKSWTNLFRSSVDVTFEHLQTLPREGSGKFRHVISEVPTSQCMRTVEQETVTGSATA